MATRPCAHWLLTVLACWVTLGAQQPRLETFKRVGQVELKAHVFEPPALQTPSTHPRPAILLLHGGGWNSGDATWVYPSARRFAARGMVAIAIDYRLSDEKTVTPLDAMADARDAFRWVRAHRTELGIDPKRVAGYGVSAGGQLVAAAAMIGRTPGTPVDAADCPDALVLLSPAIAIADSGWVNKLLLGKAQPQALSPDAFVAGNLPPTYISQGEQDTLTPFRKALVFTRHMQALGNVIELKRYSGLGHLLSRKLDEQEWQFDPDPVARADAWHQEEVFLARHGFIAPPPAVPMAPEDVVRAVTEALNAKQVSTLMGLVAPEVGWTFMEGEEQWRAVKGREVKGREGLRKAMETRFEKMPSWRCELHMVATNGAFISVRERAVWTDPNGEARSRNALAVYEVRGGLVRRAWFFPGQE